MVNGQKIFLKIYLNLINQENKITVIFTIYPNIYTQKTPLSVYRAWRGCGGGQIYSGAVPSAQVNRPYDHRGPREQCPGKRKGGIKVVLF